MTAGDPVIVTGDVGGGASVTISVPSGEVWKATAYGHTYDCRIAADTSAGVSFIRQEAGANFSGGGDPGLASRPVFDENTNPAISNRECSTSPYALMGAEL